MAKFTTTCPVCGKPFETSHQELRLYCTVGCQYDNSPPPYRPQDVIGKKLEDLDKWRIIVTAEALETAERELRLIREKETSR